MPGLVSVVIPCHNSQAFIDETITSLQHQTYSLAEYIFVDDGSTDNTRDVILKYAQNDSRISLVDNPERGAGSSRNLGAERAVGDYLIFLDSDDFFETDLLSSMVCSMEESGSDIAICEFSFYLDKTNKTKCGTTNLKNIPSPTTAEAIANQLLKNIQYSPWNKMIRADYWKQTGIRFQNCRLANDFFAMFELIVKSNVISIVDKSLVNYRIRETGSIQNKKSEYPLALLEPFENGIFIDPEIMGVGWRRRLASNVFASVMRSNLDSFSYNSVRRDVWSALQNSAVCRTIIDEGENCSSILNRSFIECLKFMSFEEFQPYLLRVTKICRSMPVIASRPVTVAVMVAAFVKRINGAKK